MKHVFVFDPKSFNNKKLVMNNIIKSIEEYFRTQENFSIIFSQYRRNAIGLIQEEAEKSEPGGMIRVYAVGGEEILFDCLNAVAHFPNMQLAIVPCGETNSFINVFQKDITGEKTDNLHKYFLDIPALINSETLSTDIIRWGVNYALNSCYIGMNSYYLKKLKERKYKLGKKSFFILSKISSLIYSFLASFDKKSAEKNYEIIIDDTDYSGKYSIIHIANTPYLAGKMTGVLDASPDDGVLDIALVSASNPVNSLSFLRSYLNGKRPKNCTIIQGKNVTIRSDSKMWIQLDDEYIEDREINLNVVHKAIQLAAPEGLVYPLGSISAL